MGLRKAQANIIGAMLLVTIVSAIWCLVWIWIYPTLETLKESLPEPRIVELTMEKLIIEDVWVKNNECIIYIYNCGEIEATISAVYINHIQVWKGNIEIGIGKGITLTVSMPQGEEIIKVLKVVTIRGGEYYWRG